MRLLNLRFDCPLDELPAHVSRMFGKRVQLRWSLVRLGGWRLLPRQLRPLARDVAASVAARALLPLLGREAFRSVRPPLHRIAGAGLAGR